MIEATRLVRWMHTVTRHEAYAVRRQRSRGQERTVARSEEGSDVDSVDLVASEAPGPDERAERLERLARSREALKSLKPNEIRALTLKAEGYSYIEIAEMTGWSRTKINRLMVEGRRRFLDTFGDIEQGRRCEQLSVALSAFSDGEIAADERSGLLEHLGQCPRCRAQLRAYRGVPKRVLEVAPIGMLAGPSMIDRVGDHLIAASDRTREMAASMLHRGGGAVEASQTAAAGGGTRGSGLALVATVCGLGAAGGGAAVCVDQGVVDNPLGGGEPPKEQTVSEPEAGSAEAPPPVPVEQAPTAIVKPEPAPVPTPTQQRGDEFGFEGGSTPSAGGASEFGGPAGGGGEGGGGGSGGGGGFGFEK